MSQSPRRIRKVLIANRGEIAVRVIRACRKRELGTVAVYSDADRAALHAVVADEALRIGPPPARESYLRIEAILQAALASGADAIHPGYGFLSENAAFAEAVEGAGLVFIGPRPESMRLMGDKVAARAAARAAELPVVPGSDGPVAAGELRAVARRIGFPVLLKAAGGGGGKGIRVVRQESELEAALAAASSEAKSAFGDPRVYVERYLERPRHIEVQVFGDGEGSAVHLGERECSLQRRHQKVLEESPAPNLDRGLRDRICGLAASLAASIKYRGAGTMEFLVEGDHFFFLEMNTRLQVEHPVTEEVTGLDLVDWQLDIASGRPLPSRQGEIRSSGHAIEVRVYAEDPDLGFLPSGGRVDSLFLPGGAGVRLETALYAGCEVGLSYDPLLAKLITRGADRAEALRRMQLALGEFVLTGPRTNLAFLSHLVLDPKVVRGEVDTRHLELFLERWKSRRDGASEARSAGDAGPGPRSEDPVAGIAAVAAALMAHEARAGRSFAGSAGGDGDGAGGGSRSAWREQGRRAGLRGS